MQQHGTLQHMENPTVSYKYIYAYVWKMCIYIYVYDIHPYGTNASNNNNKQAGVSIELRADIKHIRISVNPHTSLSSHKESSSRKL